MTTTEIEDRLRADLPRLADALTGEPVEPVSPVVVHHARRRRSSPRVLVAAATAVVLLAAAVGVVVMTRSDDESEVGVTGVVTTEPGWSSLPPSPLGPRAGVDMAWTGSEVIVWGGYRPGRLSAALVVGDGAAYDPATRTWRWLGDDGWVHGGGASVWAGDRLVTVAKQGGAEYVPATDGWRALPMLPLGRSIFQDVVWSGDTVYGVIGAVMGQGELAIARLDRAADQTADAWVLGTPQALTAPGEPGADSATWAGDEVVVWDGATGGWAYRPDTDTWRALPALPVPAPVRSAVTTVDGAVVVTFAQGDGATRAVGVARLGADEWTVVATVPAPAFGVPVPVAADGTVFVLDGTGVGTPVRVDLASGAVAELAGAPFTAGTGIDGVWTGAGLLAWAGLPEGTAASFDNPAPDVPDAAWYAPRDHGGRGQ